MERQRPDIDQLISEGQFELAFHQLVDDHSLFLLRSIQRWIRDTHHAEDVLQNTFIKIWKGLPLFRGESKLSSWCFRIAYNESMSFLRQSHKLTIVDAEDHWFEERQSDDDMDSKAIEQLLLKALESLPERQRQVFELRYYEEMSYENMAELLELSVGSLKASFHHARKKIEEHLRKSH